MFVFFSEVIYSFHSSINHLSVLLYFYSQKVTKVRDGRL